MTGTCVVKTEVTTVLVVKNEVTTTIVYRTDVGVDIGYGIYPMSLAELIEKGGRGAVPLVLLRE